jgi:four helix bundle protein
MGLEVREQRDLNNRKKFDLGERTALFGESIIDFAKKIPVNSITRRLIGQLVGAGTSVGANYHEADCAESRRDFEHKLGISKKEANETKFFLRMIVRAVPNLQQEAEVIKKEAEELKLILVTIINKSSLQPNTRR